MLQLESQSNADDGEIKKTYVIIYVFILIYPHKLYHQGRGVLC